MLQQHRIVAAKKYTARAFFAILGAGGECYTERASLICSIWERAANGVERETRRRQTRALLLQSCELRLRREDEFKGVIRT